MNLIKDYNRGLKVSYRLSILATTALLFIIVMAVTAVSNTNNLAEQINYGYEAITKPLTHTGNARSQFNAMRTSLYELALEHNTSQQNETLKQQVLENLLAFEQSINSYKEILNKYETNDSYEKDAVEYLANELPLLRQNVEHIVETAMKTGRSVDAVRMMSGSFQLAASDVSQELMLLTQILDEQSNKDKQSADVSQRASNQLTICLMISSAMAMLFIAILVARSITKPVREMSVVLGEVAKGNLNVTMAGRYKGEFHYLKKSLNATIGQLNSYISDIGSILSELSGGNYNVSVAGEYAGNFSAISEALTNIINTTNATMHHIKNSAEDVADGAQQMASSSQLLAQGTGEQASSVSQVGNAISLISEQTRANAERASQVAGLVNDIHKNAENGSTQMDKMMQAVNSINEANHNIGNIIKIIDDIAFQTNILALNAAVEAARAGTHGKGFAVVADEVRNLAAKSAEAAKDSETLITDSINKADLGTHIANETAAALSEIVLGVKESNRIVSDIAKFADEQGISIAEINSDIEQIGKIVRQNSEAAQASASSSQVMSVQAEVLQEMTARFKLK